jgi:hypothetical protein
MLKLRVICLLLLLPLFAYAQDANEELLAAARKSDVEKVKALLAKGADVNAKSAYGATPLFFACDRGSVEVVKVLLEHGADANAQDTFYKATPLGWAMGKKANPDIIRMLIEKGAKEKDIAMLYALRGGHLSVVKAVLAKGEIAQDLLDQYLMSAQVNAQPEIAAALQSAGAKERPVFKITPEALQRYEGVFKSAALSLAIKSQAGKLIGTGAGDDWVLIPVSEHVFWNMNDGATMTFTVEDNQVTGLKVKAPTYQFGLKKEGTK